MIEFDPSLKWNEGIEQNCTVHEHEVRVVLQLAHAGRRTSPAVIGGKTPMAPSALDAESADGIPPREMTDEDIATTIEAFADAAARAREARFYA